MEQKHDIAGEFLFYFVKALIKNSRKEGYEGYKQQTPQLETYEESSNIQEYKPREQTEEKELNKIRPVINRPKVFAPIVKPIPGNIDLGKLNFLINDKWIESINCSGPGKEITIKKGSKILLTHITLDEKEINKIINDFAIITRIPSINGQLKTTHNNLRITAKISDASSFLIERVFNY